MEINKKTKKELEGISGNSLVLLGVRAESYFDAVMESAAVMTRKGKKGVYVTMSRPYGYLLKEMKERKIDTENILFLDTISAMAGERAGRHCILVENPAALEEISMHINSLLDRLKPSERFLILDSFSTLLIYNSKNSVKEFAMFLMNKLRLEEVNGIMVIIEKEAPEDLKQILVAMCDKVLYV